MKIEGTPEQASFGLALAAFFLSVSTLGAAVKRGDLTMAQGSDVVALARSSFQASEPIFPCEPEVRKIAENALLLIERMTAAYSAETPNTGPH